jgi:hypothetical protein
MKSEYAVNLIARQCTLRILRLYGLVDMVPWRFRKLVNIAGTIGDCKSPRPALFFSSPYTNCRENVPIRYYL